MDPITLSILFGASALVGYAAKHNAQIQNEDHSIVLRRIYESFDGWICTELMSAEALNSVGQIMDLDLLSKWPKVESGFFKVVILTRPGAPIDRQVVVVLESAGDYGWYLNQANHHGNRKVRHRINYQRINQMIDELNKDPAEEVVRIATQISDPVRRYKYLRYALTANPRLSALLSKDKHFVDLARLTVEAPAVMQLKQHPATPPPRQIAAQLDDQIWDTMPMPATIPQRGYSPRALAPLEGIEDAFAGLGDSVAEDMFGPDFG